MSIIKEQCQLVCASHHLARCELPESHAGYCLCKKCESPIHVKRHPVGEIVRTEEAKSIWDNYKFVACLSLFLFLWFPQSPQAQDLNLNVRDVFPRDSWTQGALLVGKPENFEIARTTLTATVPVGVQDFVVESTAGIPDGLLALIYDTDRRAVDGFDVTVTGPYTLHTNKANRYQFEPGFIVQIVANVDPNGAILQGVGPGGTLRKVIIEGREVLREELVFDSRGRPRGVRWRKVR